MAKPRVFLSSTFYDWRHVRTELETFIRSMGYEPVLSERGHISYGKAESPQQYCYREIANCDVLVAIVGGKYGSASDEEPYSISQKELKAALEANKQVYIFVDKAVHAEHKTYLVNKDAKLKFAHADDPQVHKFLEELYALPSNNPIFTFESGQEIIAYLREQWAVLFKRFLEEEAKQPERDAIAEVRTAANSLNQLVGYLLEERQNTDGAIQNILLTNHPLFTRLAKLLKVKYRIFFTNLNELSEWLNARNFAYDEDDVFTTDHYVFREQRGNRRTLLVSTDLFDKGNLKPISATDWDDGMASFEADLAKEDEFEDPFANP